MKPKDNYGINLNQLASLAKNNPKYSQLYLGLSQIDTYIKKFIGNIIEETTDNKQYYIKTELMSQCYNLYLYNAERQATIAVAWPLVDFLEKCEKKTIEFEINAKVRIIIDKFNSSEELPINKTTWIY